MDLLVAAAIHNAKNALNALGVWLARARHELSARQGNPDDGVSPALARATAITATLTAQLVELLALYRAGEGSLRLTVEDHNLGDFLAEVMAELNESHPAETRIAIETDFSQAAEIGDWAFDAYLVKFALLDALRNALRYAHRQVKFSLARRQGGGIVFSVEDDGEGFPSDVLAEAAAGNSQNTAGMQAGSSGLGLRFARLIAERHVTTAGGHGRIALANDGLNGGGAHFMLLLP